MTDWADKRADMVVIGDLEMNLKLAQSFRDLVEECCKQVCTDCTAGHELKQFDTVFYHARNSCFVLCVANSIRYHFSSERPKADDNL